MIALTCGGDKAMILPQMGAGLAGLWSEGQPVLRPWSGRAEDGPFALACNLLIPFSNRISKGGFAFDGQFHPIACNLPGEPFPIHGDAFQRAWQIARFSAAEADLILPDGHIGPFRYAARVSYSLTRGALRTRLSVTHLGDTALPYGLGLHPWFPRDAATRVQFVAKGEWPETPEHLPTSDHPLPHSDQWTTPAPLPDHWINTGFSGWDGSAQIVQGGLSVRLSATGLDTVLLYSPSASSDFFCFEPVSHPVDAHNLPGQPGLAILASGATLSAAMSLTWERAA